MKELIISMANKNIGSLCIFLNNKKNSEYLDYVNSFVNFDLSISEKVYYFVNNIKDELLCECGQKKSFIGFKHGHRVTCSNKVCFTKARKKTCIEKYGVDNPKKSKIIIEKEKSNILQKWNGKHYMFDENVRNKLNKTMLNNWGVEWAQQSRLISNKSKLTFNNTKKFTHKNNKQIIFNEMLMPEKDNQKKFSYFELLDFIKLNYSQSIIVDTEFRIYLPELNLAFNFNELDLHSEKYKEKKYHIDKTKECLLSGIGLIHIWEDDWNLKKEIVKSIILNKLNKSKKIFARKCKIVIPSNKEVRDFLIKNHIQGFVGSSIKIALYYENEMVSLMTFGNLRKSLGQKSIENSYELLRFCNKINYSVVGGASKLFKFFLLNYYVKLVLSYSDNSRGVGNLYKQLGFSLVTDTVPNYYWIVDNVRKHRFNFRKDKLIAEGADPNKTEVQIMHDKKCYRIFDCGNKKWIYHL